MSTPPPVLTGEAPARRNRAMEWLYSKKNIVGCALAASAPPLLLVTGLVAPPLALALIPVMYAIGALAAPSEARQRHQLESAMGKVSSTDAQASLAVVTRSIAGNVSPLVEGKVAAIADAITDLLPRAARLGAVSDEVHILTRTATDYLPSTLAPYLAMPRRYAEHRPVSGSATAQDLLCEQLDLISDRLERIALAVNSNDANAIVSNGEFLKERFGTSALDLGQVR